MFCCCDSPSLWRNDWPIQRSSAVALKPVRQSVSEILLFKPPPSLQPHTHQFPTTKEPPMSLQVSVKLRADVLRLLRSWCGLMPRNSRRRARRTQRRSPLGGRARGRRRRRPPAEAAAAAAAAAAAPLGGTARDTTARSGTGGRAATMTATVGGTVTGSGAMPRGRGPRPIFAMQLSRCWRCRPWKQCSGVLQAHPRQIALQLVDCRHVMRRLISTRFG